MVLYSELVDEAENNPALMYIELFSTDNSSTIST